MPCKAVGAEAAEKGILPQCELLVEWYVTITGATTSSDAQCHWQQDMNSGKAFRKPKGLPVVAVLDVCNNSVVVAYEESRTTRWETGPVSEVQIKTGDSLNKVDLTRAEKILLPEYCRSLVDLGLIVFIVERQ